MVDRVPCTCTSHPTPVEGAVGVTSNEGDPPGPRSSASQDAKPGTQLHAGTRAHVSAAAPPNNNNNNNNKKRKYIPNTKYKIYL